MHHNRRPFNCSICDFGSSHKSRLEIHIKTVHEEPQGPDYMFLIFSQFSQISLKQETDQKDLSNFRKTSILEWSNTQILPNCQVTNGYFLTFYMLFTIAQLWALVVFVILSVSLMRENLKEFREKLNHKICALVTLCYQIQEKTLRIIWKKIWF